MLKHETKVRVLMALTCIIWGLCMGCTFFLWGCGGSSAEASDGKVLWPAAVKVYNIVGDGSLTRAEVEDNAGFFEEPFYRIGAAVSLQYQRDLAPAEVLDYLPGLQGSDPEYQEGRLWRFVGWARRNTKMEWGSVAYGMFPPILYNGMRMFGGMSLTICGIGRPASSIVIGQAGAWSSHTPPRDRLWSSLSIVAAHEVGHQAGANHDDGAPNLMDSAAGQYADTHYGGLWFSEWSISEIGSCVAIEKVSRVVRCLDKKKWKRCKRKAVRWIAEMPEPLPVFN